MGVLHEEHVSQVRVLVNIHSEAFVADAIELECSILQIWSKVPVACEDFV
jgi:hypothetical protein